MIYAQNTYHAAWRGTTAQAAGNMSELPLDYRTQLDLRAEIARIDRDRAETQKLIEESQKLTAEQRKLIAEAQKLTWDRWLAPSLAIAAVIGGLLGVVSFIAHLMGR